VSKVQELQGFVDEFLVYRIKSLGEIYKKPGMILLIDFSKAFDSINQEFIYETLEFLNFGHS
jgi:hypothetical protein